MAEMLTNLASLTSPSGSGMADALSTLLRYQCGCLTKDYQIYNGDVALRLDLIAKAHGIEQAEKISGKAEAVMQQMKDLGFARFTYGTQIGAYVANFDVKGIEEILKRVEADPEANGNIKAGVVDKALLMLKKSEEQILSAEKKSITFLCILTQYAAIGKKDEVIRLWEVYENQQNVYHMGYISVLASLLKFDDIESAEKIFEEWESKNLSYDIRVPNCLIAAFCRKVEATKEEISLAESWWKPTKNMAACLEYLKGKGDLDGADEIIRLAADEGLVCADTRERLLNHIKDGESNSEVPLEMKKPVTFQR
ncbi:hypothetical protein FNV43_RR15419 [Rhamnella rubrinervis]|uniref:Pentatricopeptide repeat-containing protein n=1 Tax=Rhamnella rubrinervis TaxID=2594499 RepID=A0A8K0GYB4_9ROSA|nr:hypothetical protein FNV43_RR15419 [Rhamnella rubrinervis]